MKRIVNEFNKVKPQISKLPLSELKKMSSASSLTQPRRQIHKVFDNFNTGK
ncbi:hypothetical protein [Caldivirga sp.]|uniref:hypothetical protein n=1 Tax=Caldivirga sp. TaxID=2080243 RepID=UPI0025C0C937|nr:hypothetical protein [Caldivirga sp.]